MLRPATTADLPVVADLFLAARAAAAPAMPSLIHEPDDVRDFFGRFDLAEAEREFWVAEDSRGIVGFAEVKGSWLDDLYVRPDAQGEGIGSTLLDLVKSLRPGGFSLWVFESNAPARAFYQAHGLIEMERTDGSGNEEKAPDIRMEFQGLSP